MATAKRRSVVEFEKWLDGEIKGTEKRRNVLAAQADKIATDLAHDEVRLSTLQAMKDKLAATAEADDKADAKADAKAEPEGDLLDEASPS